MQNIEIKVALADRARMEARLEALGARRMWTRRQVDTFFRVPDEGSWLKVRESDGRPSELISYTRSTGHGGPRPSDYDVLVIKEPEAWKRLLGRVLPIDAVVEKERTLWIYEHTRVHLDRVEGLGEYLELETVVDEISQGDAWLENGRVVAALALDGAQFLSVPYKDLLRAGKAQ